jgi:hypothetical protein
VVRRPVYAHHQQLVLSALIITDALTKYLPELKASTSNTLSRRPKSIPPECPLACNQHHKNFSPTSRLSSS